MATNTYVALDTKTVGTAVSSITFTSIPQGYTDLVLVASILGSAGGYYPRIRINGDTGSSYSYTWISGNGSTADSNRASNVSGSAYITSNAQFSATAPMVVETQINNYSNSTTYKTLLTRASQAGTATDAAASLWRSTAAITSLEVLVNGSTFSTGSTFTLYGIASASVGAKATGGTIYSDSSYYYHVFAANGTFTPSQSISADVLVVAGGGGSGEIGGGGGAGGFLAFSSQSLTATGYTCTVGAGGAGVLGVNSNSNSGSNSQFGALTASVGGGGGGVYSNNSSGKSGGSGGGATRGTGGQTGGSATSGQGYAGGTHPGGTTVNAGGGGGGAGGAGANSTSSAGGVGGVGVYNTLTDSIGAATGFGQLVSGHYYFAGGGGGSNDVSGTTTAGGYGGGGTGLYTTDSSTKNGTAGTGGGGGGIRADIYGGSGGSGLVIVRYAK